MKRVHLLQGIVILLSAFLLSACGAGEQAETRNHPTVSGVAVETIHLKATPDFYESPGTVRSVTSSVLGAQISGSVREIRVKIGDRVERGQVLATLDDRSVRAQYEAAEAGVRESSYGMEEVTQSLDAAAANLKLAEATYNRYQSLLEKDSVSQAEFDQAEARYKSALANQAALEARKKQLQARGQQATSQAVSAQTAFSYSRIVAPTDGVVTAKFVDAGTLVMPGTPILTVEDAAHYRVETGLPEAYLGRARVGQAIPVELNEHLLEGHVGEVAPAADPATRTFLVKIDLPRGCECSSGQFAKVEFPLGEVKRLTVPVASLVERGQLEGVFVVDSENLAEYRLVKSGRTFSGRIEILSGLSDGERVVTSNTGRIIDGAHVEER